MPAGAGGPPGGSFDLAPPEGAGASDLTGFAFCPAAPAAEGGGMPPGGIFLPGAAFFPGVTGAGDLLGGDPGNDGFFVKTPCFFLRGSVLMPGPDFACTPWSKAWRISLLP